MIETTAIRSGTIARNDANTNASTASAPEPAEHRLEQQAGPVAVSAAVLEQRVEAGQVHRLAGHRRALERRAAPPSRPAGSRRTPSPGRARVDEREGRCAPSSDTKALVARRRVGREPRAGQRLSRAACRPWRGQPSRPASPRSCPSAASPPGPAASCRRPCRGIAARSSDVRLPALLVGDRELWSSASVAGPAAAMPAIVRTIQPMTTVRLCARTQRVSEDTCTTSGGFACEP